MSDGAMFPSWKLPVKTKVPLWKRNFSFPLRKYSGTLVAMSQRLRPSEVLIRALTRSLLEIHGSGVNAAKAVGVTPSAFSKWSNGVWPSAESFDQMINASPEFSEWLPRVRQQRSV